MSSRFHLQQAQTLSMHRLTSGTKTLIRSFQNVACLQISIIDIFISITRRWMLVIDTSLREMSLANCQIIIQSPTLYR